MLINYGKQQWIQTRTLIRVRITDAALAEKRVSVLMGDKLNLVKNGLKKM